MKETLLANIMRHLDSCIFDRDCNSNFIRSNKLINVFNSYRGKCDEELKVLGYNQILKHEQMYACLRAIYELFCQQHISYAVMKGMSFEKAIYGDYALRDCGDIDIMVKEKDALKAHKILLDMGYVQQLRSSSGSLNGRNKASFVARISQQKHSTPMLPMKRFPSRTHIVHMSIKKWPTF